MKATPFEKILVILFAVAFTIGFSAILSFAWGLVLFVTWNNGVRHLINATGGHVSDVSYFTAFFTAWFITIARRLLIGLKVVEDS